MSTPFKHILIISDIEGSSGCWSNRASTFMTREWRSACIEMTQDVNTVVHALFDAGVTHVVVKDFHRTGYNLLPERIDARATVLSGYKHSPVPGIGKPGPADAVMFLGMHAASGTDGFLAHTLTSRIRQLRVNNRPLSEVELFSASLAPFGVRPIFFSGCPVACVQAGEAIKGIGQYPIDKSLDPKDFDVHAWRDGLAAAAVQSLNNIATEPYLPEGPFHAEITMRDGERAAQKVGRRWRLRLEGNRIFLYSQDIHTLYDALLKICYLTPITEKILPLGLFVFNLVGRFGLHWVRHGSAAQGDRSDEMGKCVMKRDAKDGTREKSDLKAFRVRFYRPGDDASINRFLNRIFDMDMSLDTWRWKYLKNPTTPHLNIPLGWVGNELVSHYGCRHRYYKLGSDMVLTGHPTDVAVHKSFRGGNILIETKKEAVGRAKEIGCIFGLGFPTSAHFKFGLKLLNYSHVTDMPVLEGIITGRRGLKRWSPARSIPALLSNIIKTRSRATGNREENLPPAPQVLPFRRFDIRFDILWETLSTHYMIIGDRRSPYLNWRYAEHPGRRFLMFESTRDGIVQGFTVLAVGEAMPGGERTGTFMEFFAIPDAEIMDGLFDASIHAFTAEKVSRYRCACLPHTMLYDYLTGKGMRLCGEPLKFVIEIYDEALDSGRMMDGKNWFLGFGDLDLFD